MSQLVDALNKQVADWNVLFVKLHNFHWYVKGPSFFTLHLKFEELYTEAATHIDVIAERILAIKGQPLATMKDYLAVTTIEEGKGSENAEEMVSEIAKDLTNIMEDLKKIIELAEGEGDNRTADLFIGLYDGLEKHTWMLNAFLG
ncbi:MAG: DNA starvation/stationary phase protection protein [Turicibacter sp.]|nr:DNA starvation/stationary phase protection protein [Turicibacter sp.]